MFTKALTTLTLCLAATATFAQDATLNPSSILITPNPEMPMASHILYPGEALQITPWVQIKCETAPLPPLPPLPPEPLGPECQLKGPGVYDRFSRDVRVAIDGTVIEGHDTLSSALGAVAALKNAQVCEPRPTHPCRILGVGVHDRFKENNRVAIGGEVIAAAANVTDALNTVQMLQAAGVCHVNPVEPCVLLGSGVYDRFRRNFRVAVGNEVIEGHDTQTSALSSITTLRSRGLCK